MLNELFQTSRQIPNLFKEMPKMPYLDNADMQYLFSEYTHFFHPDVTIGFSSKIENQKAIKALKDLPAGTVIFIHTGKVISINTRTSIQIGDNKHVEPGPYGTYTNHSCEPNGVIRTRMNELSNTATIALVASKQLKKDDEITFDYATTESSVTLSAMNCKCLCGSMNCRGKIMGFDDISESERQYLLNSGLLADHLKKRYDEMENLADNGVKIGQN